MVICVWAPGWSEAPVGVEGAAAILAVAPRVAAERDLLWVDGRGLDARVLAHRILEQLTRAGVRGAQHARAAVANVGVAAEVAVRTARDAQVCVIAPGDESARVAGAAIAVLCSDARLRLLLEGVGVQTCGDLARLDREAVEVRFGAEAVQLWRRCRVEEPHRFFPLRVPERPHASLDFIDYVVTDPERLIFTSNALLGTVCDALVARGEHARRLTLTLALANRQTWERTLKPARPSASRATWLRLIRGVLERLSVPDAVAGLALEVDGTEVAAAVQGDLFDAGFATASAVEAAVARILEAHGDIVVRAEPTQHPLEEEASRFAPDAAVVLDARARAPVSDASAAPVPGELTLQLLDVPEPILVETVQRRDHDVPIRYRDTRGWTQLVQAAGPDRVSGARWADAYAREYYRVVGVDGRLVWIYRDAREEAWYMHGWWD